MRLISERGTEHDGLLKKYFLVWDTSGQRAGQVKDIIELLKFMEYSRENKLRYRYIVSISSDVISLIIDDNRLPYPNAKMYRITIKYNDISENAIDLAFYFGRFLDNLVAFR